MKLNRIIAAGAAAALAVTLLGASAAPVSLSKGSAVRVSCPTLLTLTWANTKHSAATLKCATTVSTSTAPATGWPPGFTAVFKGQTNLGFRWLESNEFSCDYSTASCNGLDIVARQGCRSGLYVTVNFLNAAGAIVDDSIDSVSVAPAGKVVQLVFNTFDDTVVSAQLSGADCFNL